MVDGHSSALPQVDSIVADVRLEVCDASYIAFVMKKGRDQIAAGQREISSGADVGSHLSKSEGVPATSMSGSAEDEGPTSDGVKRSRTVSAVRQVHFSKSARSGAPPLISAHVKGQTRLILPG